MGRLTTHILDTAAGRPAAAIPVSLFRCENGATDLIAQSITNDDGRCDGPILDGAEFVAGRYQLVFHAGDYLQQTHAPLPDVPFLEDVVIAFGIAAPDQHYHVPLLLSPYGYSTYRGS